MNCVLSNPFYRMTVIHSDLIKNRIAAISDRQILMDEFLGVFQKSFRHSSITIMHDEPITKCSINISADDKIEVEWVGQLRDLLNLSDQITINVDNDDNVDDREDDLCDIILQKYNRYFPCSIICNIIDKGYKVVIIVPSLEAKKYSMNKLTEYAVDYIKHNTQYGGKEKIDSILNELIKYEIGDIEEQCNFDELELQFTNQTLPEKVPERARTIQMISGETRSNRKEDEDKKREEDEDEAEKRRNLCCTLSGIVQCDDGDIYVITTGHGMSNTCTPINSNYTLIGRMWPSALLPSDADDVVKSKSYDSTLNGGDKEPFVSDVAILQPNIDIRTVTECPRSDIIKYHMEIRGTTVPIIPGYGTTVPINKLKAKVVYTGCRTKGEMEVVGSGHFCQRLNTNYIYEKFYVAIHISSHLNEKVDDVDGSNGTIPGDSGARVTTLDGKIHSFLIGMTTGDDKFRLLSPAHFVLEQIKSMTGKKNVDFVRSVKTGDVLSRISRSAQSIIFRPFNRSVRDDDINNDAIVTGVDDDGGK